MAETLLSLDAAVAARADALGTHEALQRRASAGYLDDPDVLVEAQAKIHRAALQVEAAQRR
ncbi:MAG TPA: hypothetical protein VGM10_04660 [Actinocrinis sp.]